MKTIQYNGNSYKTNVAENEKYAGGIWDLAGEVASDICEITNADDYSHYEEIQELIYNFVKYDILSAKHSAME